MAYRKSSHRRWIAGVALVGAASAGLYLATRGGDSTSSAAPKTPSREAPRRAVASPSHAAPAPVAVAAAAAPTDDPPHVPLELGKGDPSPSVKKWTVPGVHGTFREIVSPDDGENVQEKLTYRIRRLRFALADAAMPCYDGKGDGMDEMELAYDLVVSHGTITIENLQELSSTWSDPRTHDCILDAIRSMHTAAPDVPDMRLQQEQPISQHDLYERSKSVD